MKTSLHLFASLIPVLLFSIVYIGDTYRAPVLMVSIFFGLLAVLAAATLWPPVIGKRPLSESLRRFFTTGGEAWWIRLSAVVAAGFLWVLISDRPYQGMIIFSKQPAGFQTVTIASTALLGVLLIKPPKPVYATAVLLAAGMILRLFWFSEWEINPARRDMLALVVSAIETFLRGENPYGFHQMQPGSLVPLTYPPGLWLLHLPAYVAGLDIRWTAFLADGVIVTSFCVAALQSRPASFGPVFLCLAAYLFLPDIHWNAIYAEPHADWALLALLSATVLTRKPLWSAAVLGIALTTRPFNLVLVPFFGVWAYRELGLRQAWRMLLIAGFITATVYLPFVLWDPDAFYSGTVRWLLEYGAAHRSWFHTMMSFSSLLYQEHLDAWLGRIQLLVLVGMAILSWFQLRTTRGLFVFWSFTYGLFVAFNSIVWMSFWIGVCLLSIGLSCSRYNSVIVTGPPTRSPFFSGPRRWLMAEAAAAAVVTAAFLLMAGPLVRHFDDSGEEEAKRYAAARIDKDTLVIDASGYRVAFLQTPDLLPRARFTKGGMLGRHPFGTRFPGRRVLGPLSARRIVAVERFGLFREMMPLYMGNDPKGGGPYALKTERRFGSYRVVELEKRPDAIPLFLFSHSLERLSVSATVNGKPRRGEYRPTSWRFGGRGRHEQIEVRNCRIDRVGREMIFAHPLENGVLEMGAELEKGARWVTVYGGLLDRKAAWHRSDIAVKVKGDGKRLDRGFGFPNEPGMTGASFALPKGASRVTLEISVENPTQRAFCFDAVVTGKAPTVER